jgi:hypothetical protein
MTFNVLDDGTILDSNGITIGAISIQSNKYRTDIIKAIEKPFTVEFYDDVIETCKIMTADNIHESIETIRARLSAYPDDTINTMAAMIESIGYYK